jgi:hypothetical protein
MLDIGRRETSLDTKRHELAGKIAEGRTVIASLLERHAMLGEKIEVATASLRRMEQQHEALNTVRGLFSEDELLVHEPRPAPAPVAAAATAEAAPHVRLVETPVVTAHGLPFRPFAYMRCMIDGHDMVISRSMSGRMTCRRCRVRHKL